MVRSAIIFTGPDTVICMDSSLSHTHSYSLAIVQWSPCEFYLLSLVHYSFIIQLYYFQCRSLSSQSLLLPASKLLSSQCISVNLSTPVGQCFQSFINQFRPLQQWTWLIYQKLHHPESCSFPLFLLWYQSWTNSTKSLSCMVKVSKWFLLTTIRYIFLKKHNYSWERNHW